MTERDESRDVFVVSKFGKPLRVYPGDTQVIDSPDGSEGCFRYVHLDQYTELETRLENARSSERQAMEGANKAIEERDRLRELLSAESLQLSDVRDQVNRYYERCKELRNKLDLLRAFVVRVEEMKLWELNNNIRREARALIVAVSK